MGGHERNWRRCYFVRSAKGLGRSGVFGVIMLGERGIRGKKHGEPPMVINMRKWLEVMDSYVNGGFAYYTTMPTDALALFNGAANETKKIGFDKVKQMAWDWAAARER